MIEVLHRLARRALAQVVEAGHDDQTLARRVQRESDVAEIRVRHMLQLRQFPHRPDTHHWPPRVELPVQRFYAGRSEEHTSELQSRSDLVCRLLLEKKTNYITVIL